MFVLRSLLDTVGASPGDESNHISTVRAMFPSPTEFTINPVSSPSPAARTAVVVRKHLAIHQLLWAMSEGYSTSDTRTVRSVDLSQLDELYDIVKEACGTKLFGLRASPQASEDEQEQSDAEQDATDEGVPGTSNREVSHQADSALDTAAPQGKGDWVETTTVAEPRRLLLNALITKVTAHELSYMYHRLSSTMQQEWNKLSQR